MIMWETGEQMIWSQLPPPRSDTCNSAHKTPRLLFPFVPQTLPLTKKTHPTLCFVLTNKTKKDGSGLLSYELCLAWNCRERTKPEGLNTWPSLRGNGITGCRSAGGEMWYHPPQPTPSQHANTTLTQSLWQSQRARCNSDGHLCSKLTHPCHHRV